MSRAMAVLGVLFVALLAMGFAIANAGNRVTLSLGFVTLFRVPVALVAFCGLFVGMVLMFATGVFSDLKVRRILRERFADESQREQRWIDRNQQDLFSGDGDNPSIAEGASVPEPPAVEGELMEE